MNQPQSPTDGRRFTTMVYFFGALGELMFGFDTGVIGVALLFIKKEMKLDSVLQGWVVSSLLLGAAIGVGCAGILSDRFGRRPVLQMMAAIFALGALGAALSPNVIWLIFFRCVMGLGVGASAVVVTVYLAEIAPTEHRGRIASLGQLMVVCGILLSYILDYALSPIEAWRWMIGLGLVPSMILLLGLFYLPESPRWLVKRNRIAEAEAILRRMGRAQPESEAREIEAIEAQQVKRGLGAALRELAGPGLRLALIATLGLAVLTQLMGINSIIYYAPTTLVTVGFGQTASIIANVGIGALNVIVTMIALYTVDRLGRRRLLLLGCIGMVLAMVILGITTLALPRGNGVVAVVTLLCLLFFVVSFGMSWGVCVRVVISELLPLSVRGSAMGLVLVLNWLANFLVSLMFPIALASVGIAIIFLTFAVIGIITFCFVFGLVPETKGRSLEKIEADLRQHGQPFVVSTSQGYKQGSDTRA
ncbi:MAG: sugar porter family MFS transporter [Ktedonobacteraceae bacterium]|nr:sugar porter family MFS transporter [Ktedonobacteraceae bacterium]MBO0790658.1 sugar porter family MFS transporter [Ktedonobacteraceae bacterium]